MSQAPILLLTHAQDYYCIDLVQAALEAKGARAWRIDTDRFPTEATLALGFAGGAPRWPLRTAHGEVDLLDVPAFWARRLWPGALPGGLDPQHATWARQQARTAFFDGLALLEGARWVNPIRPMVRAESKLLQLDRAAGLGWTLPPTLVTNEPDEVRRFFADQDGRVVTKLLGALSQTMNATGDFMYTSRVREADLDALDSLRLCPQIFQREIEKARELRIVVVGDRLFTGSIDARGTARGEVDWRRLRPGEGGAWHAEELPPDVAERTLALARALDLVYAAIDVIVTPEGEAVFLEVNPAGEWGWLQRDLGLPIAEALADELLRKDTA